MTASEPVLQNATRSIPTMAATRAATSPASGVWGPVSIPCSSCACERLADEGGVVAEQDRPEAVGEVDVLVPVDVPEPRAGGADGDDRVHDLLPRRGGTRRRYAGRPDGADGPPWTSWSRRCAACSARRRHASACSCWGVRPPAGAFAGGGTGRMPSPAQPRRLRALTGSGRGDGGAAGSAGRASWPPGRRLRRRGASPTAGA